MGTVVQDIRQNRRKKKWPTSVHKAEPPEEETFAKLPLEKMHPASITQPCLLMKLPLHFTQMKCTSKSDEKYIRKRRAIL